jgi:hypothetical protein
VATFNAGTVLESLDFDFTAMAEPPNSIAELADAKGTIKEPTALQVQTYMQSLAREMQRQRREARAALAAAEKAEADGTEPPDETDEQLTVLADADKKKADAARRREAAMVSRLCSGFPGTEMLLLLPHRIANEFGAWLIKEVTDPEAVTGAGSPHLQMVRSPAAG